MQAHTAAHIHRHCTLSRDRVHRRRVKNWVAVALAPPKVVLRDVHV